MRPTNVNKNGHRKRLPAEPFRQWLIEYIDTHELTITQVALMTGYNDRMIRAILNAERPTIQERTVERIGIALDRDPRVTEDLYPYLLDEAA